MREEQRTWTTFELMTSALFRSFYFSLEKQIQPPLSPCSELQRCRESGWSMRRAAPSRDSSCCRGLWSRHGALASAGLARNHTAVVQRVERDLKGRLILQMEGSCPVMLTPTGITDSHLKCHLASNHVVPWSQTHRVSLTDKAGGEDGLGFRKSGAQSLRGCPAYQLHTWASNLSPWILSLGLRKEGLLWPNSHRDWEE